MASPSPVRNEDEERPLDPAAERVRRKLVRFMAINLGILFAAVMAVVLALVYRSLSMPEPEAAAPPSEIPLPPPGAVLSGTVPVPVGARLLGHSLSGSRLTLDLETGDGRSILIYDLVEARVVGRFALVPEGD